MTVPTPGSVPVAAANDCDLLAPVPLPEGATAGPWQTDVRGHLHRVLDDGRMQLGNGQIVSECIHCTVPVDTGDIYAFCESYTPPESAAGREDDALEPDAHCFGLALAEVAQHARFAFEDIEDAFEVMPDEAPLPAVVDLVTARAHLIAAQRLIDKAATRIAATEVTR